MRVLRPIGCRLVVVFLVVLGAAGQAFADVVTPTSEVTTRVIVRESASSQSAQVGRLQPGQQLELVGSVPYWYEVRLTATATGFVSKRWSEVIPTVPPPPRPTPPQGPTFSVDVVDVGTGLGVLVRGQDFTLVYDGGSNDDLSREPGNRFQAYLTAVAPTLTTLDHMVLSHPHREHVRLRATALDREMLKTPDFRPCTMA